uniref:Uncharacterized protein n=1 Tax=Neogobius melanostomus TaxID=47308 RepID=A0A8C6SKS9_9GOBI
KTSGHPVVETDFFAAGGDSSGQLLNFTLFFSPTSRGRKTKKICVHTTVNKWLLKGLRHGATPAAARSRIAGGIYLILTFTARVGQLYWKLNRNRNPHFDQSQQSSWDSIIERLTGVSLAETRQRPISRRSVQHLREQFYSRQLF